MGAEGGSVDWYLSRQKTLDGEGLDPAVMPGALHAALTVLERWGTMSFEEVAAPAIEYAEKGFPMRAEHGARDPESAEVLRELAGQPEVLAQSRTASAYKPGETIKLPTLARTLRRMVEAERAAKTQGPSAGIVAARDRFYKGDIAREMVAFLQKHERAVRAQRLRRVLRARRGAGEDDLSRLHGLQARHSAARGRCCCRR